MAEILTDWVPVATDARNGSDRFWPWARANDDEVAVDLAEMLDTGEAVTNLVVTMLQLKATVDGVPEANDADATNLLVGAATVSGTVVRQRMAALVFQRVYRCYFTFGPAGNKRTSTAVVWCVA